MSSNSHIEWTEATWNPVVGCTRASAGCDHCYAVTMTHRLEAMGKPKYAGLTVLNNKGDRHFNGKVRTVPKALDIPLHWRKPRRVFVNSMSDLFHKDVPQWFIHEVLHVIKACPQHTFQVLTKRPERMASIDWKCSKFREDYRNLPNLWLGTSIEDQATADERIPHLLRCPAAVRFLSCEPLLDHTKPQLVEWDPTYGDEVRSKIDWVIVGCESRGTHAGRFAGEYPGAAQSIINQCREAGVAVFHKQCAVGMKVSKNPLDWDEPLRIREYPAVASSAALSEASESMGGTA